MDLKIIRANVPPTVDDVRELREFLESFAASDEKALQRLLERHPSLVGVLGFTDFLSEVPIFKVDENNEPVLLDRRKRDRADLIAAEQPPFASAYRAASIIELKGATQPIRERSIGFRLSEVANHAVNQLHEYRHWLTTVRENRDLLKRVGWDVRLPQLSLIMGRSSEFVDNPGQYGEIRSHLQSAGVRLYTIDDVINIASQQVEKRIVPPNVTAWSWGASAKSEQFAGVVIDDLRVAFNLALADPATLATMPRAAFRELVVAAYCRTGYKVTGLRSKLDQDVFVLFTTREDYSHSSYLVLGSHQGYLNGHREIVGLQWMLESDFFEDIEARAVLVTTDPRKGVAEISQSIGMNVHIATISEFIEVIKSVH